ncbi:hypothetical protein FOZ62_004327, partial [Perkinsus olseni]
RSVVLSPSDVVKAGYVMKQSKHLLQWKRRWLVLTKDMLCSFSTKGALAYPTEALLLRMCSSVKSADEETGQANSFKVDSSSRVFYLIAETPADKEAWIGQIGRQMIRPAVILNRESEVEEGMIRNTCDSYVVGSSLTRRDAPQFPNGFD